MFGQVTMEYLVLSLVAISMLAVSLSALIAIKDSSARLVDDGLLFRLSAQKLGNAISEVCAMGSGNRRVVALDSQLAIETETADDGSVVRFRNSASSLVSHSLCPVIAASAQLEGGVIVENVGGEVALREQ